MWVDLHAHVIAVQAVVPERWFWQSVLAIVFLYTSSYAVQTLKESIDIIYYVTGLEMGAFLNINPCNHCWSG